MPTEQGAFAAHPGVSSSSLPSSSSVFKDSADLVKVHGAVDQNGDGSLELLAGPEVFADEISVLRIGNSGYERQSLFANSFWDCGC